MNGDIKLTAPGGRPGDIWLGAETLETFKITGRVVSTDGTPRTDVEVSVFERRSLTVDARLGVGRTDPTGVYAVAFTLPATAASSVFVRAEDAVLSESVDSRILSDLVPGTRTVDLLLGTGTYEGRTEWDRIEAKLTPLLGSTQAKDIPASRLEWLATRADVFPTHLAAYIQAHRLADGNSVKPETCYAFLRAGLPADLLGLVRSGESRWESALRSAWSGYLLPRPGAGTAEDLDEEVTDEIAAMNELVVDAAVATPASGVNQRVILDTAGLSEAEQRTFTELWINRTGTVEEFWTAVDGSSLSAEAALLRFTVQAATVTGNHVETLEALQAERTATNISTIADTTAWSPTDWDDVLVARSVTPPDDVPGADATEKRQNYARALFNIVEDGHPSLSLRHSIDRETTPPPNTEFLVTFLTNNPDFDVVRSTVAVYLAGAVSPWTGIDPEDEAQARQNLETIQRVYRVTPRIGRYATTKVLLDEGITSASQIVKFTRTEFVTQFGPLFSDLDHHQTGLAEAVWDTAGKIHSTAIALGSTYAFAKGGGDPPILGTKGPEQFVEAPNGLSGLATILGNLDYCACEHCRSVFSPAAYLTDLLAFLDDRDALDELVARRPDLVHILMDCDNTNTVLPYIDLVNELLESYVLTEGNLPDSSKQTTWLAKELRLHPEHLKAAVYDDPPPEPYEVNTTTLVHPWTLPFSLPTVETQTYLRHLGVPRHELMRRYLHIIPDELDEDAIAGDVLGLSAVEFLIVRKAYTGNASEDDREFWGFSSGSESDNWIDILNGTDDPDGDVGELLLRGGFTLDQLRELLELDYINPGGTMVLQFDDSCSLLGASIAFMDDPAQLDRIHRFTRLQRACQIPARMLNVLIMDALGGTIDRWPLRYLADIVRLKARLRLDWDALATFWADVIDAREYASGERSLYRRRFLAKELGDAAPFEPEGTTLAGEETPPDGVTTAQLPRVLAGMGAKETEYRALVASALVESTEVEGVLEADFSFANLTALFRSTQFARGMKLSVADLARVAGTTGLIGEDPFTNPTQTLRFVGLIDGIRESGFSISELDWLLRHQFDGVDPIDPEETNRILSELSRGLVAIEAETAQLAESSIEALETNLAKVLTGTDFTTAISIVDQSTVLSDEDQNTFIDAAFGSFVDTTQAKAALVGALEIPELELRIAWLLGRVVGHLRRKALVLETIAAKLGIATTVAEALVTATTVGEAVFPSVLTDPAGDDPLFEVYRMPFATEEQIAVGLAATHSNEFAGWHRLTKAALVCQRFELRADEVAWYSGQFAGWLDLDELPVAAVDADVGFDEFDGLRLALELRDLSKPGEIAFAQIADAANFGEAIEILADHAGWDPVMVHAIATAIGYSEVTQVSGGTAPERLRVIVDTANRLGVSLDTPLGWVAASPATEDATAIKLAARAKYGEDRWPDVAAPLRDVIRERQRDALLDAAMATTPTFRTSNDVFEHLLIDVEMGHCMMTSRILQAITAVQIFIHRVFLHLETVQFDAEAIARWDWMKNYRVWEANRKVFLYPENWIEPELRLNKTDEFEALEAVLMQGGLDVPRVEKALETYLEKLDRVSSLEVVGVYDSFGDTWVLGRTHSKPHEWFVRRRSAAGAWTAWEEVPVEIDSDAVAMVVEENRLHLFWTLTQDRQHWYRPYKPFYVAVIDKGNGKYTLADAELLELGEPLAGVIYQIAHVERTVRGEWTKPQLSEPSAVQVALGKSTRLHVWLEETEVRLAVLADWPAEASFVLDEIGYQLDPPSGNLFIYLRAAFSYSRVEREIYFLGSTFAEKGPVHLIQVYLSETDKQLADEQAEHPFVDAVAVGVFTINYIDRSAIALQGEYSLRGPRFEYSEYREGLGSDWENGDVIDHYIQVWAPQDGPVVGTDKFLFTRPSANGIPAFVHQSNMWVPSSHSRLFPIVYDDRKRKFLLDPTQVWMGHDGDGTQPLGQSFDTGAFYECPPDEPSTVLPMAPPKLLTSQRRDKYRGSSAYPQGAPQGGGGQFGGVGNVAIQQQAEEMVTEAVELNVSAGDAGDTELRLRLELLYHPFSKLMIGALAKQGLTGLYLPTASDPLFRQEYEYDPFVEDDLGPILDNGPVAGFPVEDFDFGYDTGYGIYNWELFYHVPMLLAGKLAAEQRWDDAQRWYHMVFNPIDVVDEEGPSKFWRIKPFVQQAGSLAFDQIEAMLGIGVTEAQQIATTEAFAKQVEAWEANPFDPHAVARIRPGVYQRALIRKYFDNLIAWGDHLFRRDTFESISEATVLYILVAQLLGPRPQEVPGTTITAKSFTDFMEDGGLDPFSNALIELESWIYLPSKPVEKKGCEPSVTAPWVKVPVVSRFWYFCYPPNPELLKYWDILEDRLFKLRHCQNIEGIERQLPLFQPPIDPALLVAAIAAGVDIQSVLAELDSGLPPYRFRSVHGRAVSFASSLKALGGALLSALEKQDGEELALIRSQHERDMLDQVRDVRVEQVADARAGLRSQEAARALAEDRRLHYAGLITQGLSEQEDRHFELTAKGARMRRSAGATQIVAGVLSLVPQINVGTGGVSAEFGGVQLAGVANAIASVFSFAAGEHDYHANKANLRASYDRREEDWDLQLSQAEKDIVRADKDIIGAKIRVEIAERELDNHDLQVAQAREVGMWMHSKFTNQQLYNWMVGQLSTLYFQTYQVAFDLAKRSERAYRHELFVTEGAPIIKYGYWDSLRKGLLAGEKLGLDLERLDLAYMDRDVRELELRKSISLAELSPTALQALQETGTCTFSLPEVVFDLDHPGHYLRRIRGIRLTIPAVVGPFTSLGARLQLGAHKIRTETAGGYAEEPVDSDERFQYRSGAGQAIATSTAVQDAGVFNLDFKDERYLPFEYAGAISQWSLTLPAEVRQFDYRTIEDVIVHIDYTARYGGDTFRGDVEEEMVTQLNEALEGQTLGQLVVVHDAFPNEWEQFLTSDGTNHVLTLPVTLDHFPYFARRNGLDGLEVTEVDFKLLLAPELASEDLGTPFDVDLDIGGSVDDAFDHVDGDPGQAYCTAEFTPGSPEPVGTWTMTVAEATVPGALQDGDDLDPTKVVGMLMLIRYALS